MLLLDENREVTMLITNSLKNDLDHSSQYVVALALCTLGNICSAEMARDLGPDVERIMRNGPPYLKKKDCGKLIRSYLEFWNEIEWNIKLTKIA